MKKVLLLLTCLLFVPFLVQGQWVINNFDTLPDTSYWEIYADGGEHTYLNLSLETNNVYEGTGALKMEWQNECYDQYGGWIGVNHIHPDSLGVYDFSPYTHISLWYYVETPQSKPGKVHFRIILQEGGPGTDWENDEYETWFSHHFILDSAPGWNQIYVEMKDIGIQSNEGFWNPGWGQTAEGNGILELDKIRGWILEFSQDGTLWQAEDDTVSGVLLVDDFELQGAAPINIVFFNGKSIPSNVSMFTGWSGTVEVTDEEAATAGTNSIKWTTGSGWDGVNFLLDHPKNMIFNWSTDSIQLKIKAPAGLGDLMLIFHDPDEDGDVKEDYPFQATYLITEADYSWDNTWKQVKVALKDFNRFNGCWDGDLGQMVPGEFDSTKLEKFTIAGNGQDFEGMTVYIDDIWTGNPVFDWIPPEQVSDVDAVASDYFNLVIWQDVSGEASETYNVYASTEPITDVHAANVEIIAKGVVENTQTAVHWLYYPLVDHDVTYYYAVECVDASGNIGPAGYSGAISNTGKGVATISLTPPENFAADGDLSEWDASGIMPWILTPEENNVAIGEITDNNDLTGTVYLAIDDDYLYVAVDVIDDVFSYETSGNWWDWDAFEFFIGLYDLRGAEHTSIKRGEQPDYKLVFLKDRLMNDFNSSATIYTSDNENYYFEDLGGVDYVIEAKVPLDSIKFGEDVRFYPIRGMRIPFDLYFHDNDGSGWEGNLAFSPDNTDLGWKDPRQWTYTWIGDTTNTVTAVKEDGEPEVVTTYSLGQNYPNPFNPSTSIIFTLPQSGKVTINVYNALGQKVATLVDGFQREGIHKIKFNANNLPSGVYFYRIKAGEFSKTMKMLLMK